MKKILFITIVFLSFQANYVFAATAWFGGYKGHGWFWYQKNLHKKNTKKPKTKQQQIITHSMLHNMSAKQLHNFLHKLKYIAVGRPTYQNLLNYIYVQHYAIHKADQFTNMWQYVMYKNPTLDYYAMKGGASAFHNRLDTIINKNKIITVLNYLDKHSMIVLFYSPTNQSNYEASRLLAMYYTNDHMPYKLINVKEHPNMTSEAGIIKTPEYVLLYNNPKTHKVSHYYIAVGLHSEATLSRQIYYIYTHFISKTDKEESTYSTYEAPYKVLLK